MQVCTRMMIRRAMPLLRVPRPALVTPRATFFTISRTVRVQAAGAQKPPKTPKDDDTRDIPPTSKDTPPGVPPPHGNAGAPPHEDAPQKQSLGFVSILGLVIAGGAGYAIYNLVTSGEESSLRRAVDESVVAPASNFVDNVVGNVKDIFGTPRRVLLPPPLQAGYGRKYTLVVDMDALCHTENKNGTWILHKRAGVDFFLGNLFQLYEIVLYTKEYPGTNNQAIFKLDPTSTVLSHIKNKELGGIKDADNHFTQDWEMLNRDPSKVIFFDSISRPYDHPNTLFAGKSTPGKSDTVLLSTAALLVELASRKVDDVRPIVKKFAGDELEKTIQLYTQAAKAAEPAPKPVEPEKKGWFSSWFGGN
eukprot:TRINITY_DN1551_c0_g1_i2.p1 TRINITY_DN1551_c0_g1~~TRINITY_DN1551_c0_g1_i2.p1  ORF type:complete len:362 (+),score=109.01 TRINITY_DN1551_c0_g1_i2:1-1086(+)